jgi:hypothetical protein
MLNVELLLFLFSIQLVNEFKSDKLLQSDFDSPDQNSASASETGATRLEVTNDPINLPKL